MIAPSDIVIYTLTDWRDEGYLTSARPSAQFTFPKCMVRRPTAREKGRVDRQVCADVFGL
jgi:hypothetical protein